MFEVVDFYWCLYVWYLQPEDWDDKEYIPDPEDKKPEVMMP